MRCGCRRICQNKPWGQREWRNADGSILNQIKIWAYESTCVCVWSVNLNIWMITIIINTRAHSSLQLFHQYSNYFDDTAFFVIWVFNFLKNFCIILYWHGGVSVSYIIVWFRNELFFLTRSQPWRLYISWQNIYFLWYHVWLSLWWQYEGFNNIYL